LISPKKNGAIKMKIDFFISYLNSLYPNAKCSLNYSKDYELLIAVMLSAQTNDKAVNKVTKILFKKYNSIKKLKQAKLQDVEEIIHPLGMYKIKASNIVKIAQMLTDKIPENRDELMEFPGVGQKVANVVLAELYHLPYFAVDTHCARIAKRIKLVKSNDDVKAIEEKIIKIVPKAKLISLNHQMIEFGREICKAKNPRCKECKMECVI